MPEDRRFPILCFDGDAAGQRAAARAMDRVLPILKPDHSVRFAFLPEAHDPDSLLKAEGATAMAKVLKNDIGLFEMLWQEESKGRDLSQPESKAGLRAGLEKRARQIADMTVQKFFVHTINQEINKVFLSEEPRRQRPGRQRFAGKKIAAPPGLHSPHRPPRVKAERVRSEVSRRDEQVRILLAVMIHYPELYEDFGEHLGMLAIGHKEYDKIRQALINLLGEDNSLDYQAVKQHLNSSGYGEVLESIFDSSLYLHAGFAKPGQSLETARQAWQDIWERAFVNTKAIRGH